MQSDGQPLPGVSYVMPVLNEVTEVRAAVGSLLDQDYTGSFEVILALGPSIDGTNELVAEMSAADPRIRAIDNPVGSTPAGLNVAIRASVHPVVIRVDAHSVLPTDYTRIAVRTLLESGADNVGGIMRAEGRTPSSVPLPWPTAAVSASAARRTTWAAPPARPRPPTSACSDASGCSTSDSSTRASSAARTGNSTGGCARPVGPSGSRRNSSSPTARDRA